MIFTETPLKGAYVIDLEKRGDDRGFFARAFCEKEFGAHRLATHFVQVNNSLSAQNVEVMPRGSQSNFFKSVPVSRPVTALSTSPTTLYIGLLYCQVVRNGLLRGPICLSAFTIPFGSLPIQLP